MISDVTSTGERSTECRKASWLDGVTEPLPGARFRGHNRSGLARWSRVCEILDAEPGLVFSFRTVPERRDPSRADSTIWRYELFGCGSLEGTAHATAATGMTPP